MLSPILLTGVALGILQLMAGIAVGLWIGPAFKGVRGKQGEDRKRAQRLAGELRTLTADLSSQVREQSDHLKRVETRLRSETSQDASLAEHPITSLITGVMREMLAANTQLQQKLTNAELELEAKASEMDEHRTQAMTDQLTGLPNRRAMDDCMRQRMEEWRRRGTPFSLVMLDLDHFKQFNDTHGHPAGDMALKTAGQALREALRQHDLVTRFGGEEFALILPHATLESAQAAVRKAISAVHDSPIQVSGRPVTITASAGVASVCDSDCLEGLVQRADQALYAAKENGRNQAWMHDGLIPCPLDSEGDLDPLSEDPPLASACSDLRDSVTAFLAD